MPRLHEEDGGRYIGTDDMVIMRDPEEDWVNAATYRIMLHSRNHTGLWMSPGKQGRQIMEKYFKMGKACPVLVSCGHDPLLFLAANQEVRYGVLEFDYAGGHRGQPIDVVLSELHRLPMPAHAEIVFEGEIQPGDVQQEGPFGEFTGYYASPASQQPVIRVKRVYHRNRPDPHHGDADAPAHRHFVWKMHRQVAAMILGRYRARGPRGRAGCAEQRADDLAREVHGGDEPRRGGGQRQRLGMGEDVRDGAGDGDLQPVEDPRDPEGDDHPGVEP